MRSFNDHSISAFAEDHLYLTRANRFNDPYDCLLYFDSQKLQEQIDNKLSKENILTAFQNRLPNLSIEEHIVTSIVNQLKPVFMAEVSKICPQTVDMLQRNMYIACFTEDIKSPIMWSHYADYHKGFAIEYQFDSDMFYPRPLIPGDDRFGGYGWRSLLPVHYSKHRTDGTSLADWYSLCEMASKTLSPDVELDLSSSLPDMLLKTKLSLHKAEMWAYEKEWRMILSHEYPNSFGEPIIHFIAKAAGIYLGAKMRPEYRQQLINIATQKAIPIYEMVIDHASKEYEMKCNSIM